MTIVRGIAMIFGGRLRGSWMSCTRWLRSCASRRASAPAHDLPEALFHVFTNLIEADVDEAIVLAGGSIELRDTKVVPHDVDDRRCVMSRVAESLEDGNSGQRSDRDRCE